MSKITLRSVTEASVLKGTRVLLRMSLNLPLTDQGAVADTYRLERSLPTIKYLIEKGAKVVVVGYIGREGGTLAPVAKALQALLDSTEVRFTTTPAREARPEVEALPAGACLMLENIRREPGEENGDLTLAQELASLAEVFVDDAFAEAHRSYASNVGVAKILPAYAGLLMQEEVSRLSDALMPPPGAVAIIGGAKFETKQPLIEQLLTRYHTVLLGGALGSDLLKARGLPTGASLVSPHVIPESLAGNDALVQATDIVLETPSPDGENGASRQTITADVRANERIVDIGPGTIETWAGIVATSPFVLWNGPVGMYERGYVAGTKALAEALAGASCKAVIGGGDTAAALAKFQFDKNRIFVSTGGGATLDFLTHGGSLPATDVLRD